MKKVKVILKTGSVPVPYKPSFFSRIAMIAKTEDVKDMSDKDLVFYEGKRITKKDMEDVNIFYEEDGVLEIQVTEGTVTVEDDEVIVYRFCDDSSTHGVRRGAWIVE